MQTCSDSIFSTTIIENKIYVNATFFVHSSLSPWRPSKFYNNESLPTNAKLVFPTTMPTDQVDSVVLVVYQILYQGLTGATGTPRCKSLEKAEAKSYTVQHCYNNSMEAHIHQSV
jgi:hypothetical protein